MAHKNLSYESKEPAFLQRLRAQTAGIQQERPLNRPKKQRNPEDEEEDEPVYVLEDNTTLSGKEFEALKDKTVEEAKASEEDHDKADGEGKKTSKDSGKDGKDHKARDSVLDVGAKSQKRKIAKVVGAETSGGEEEEKEPEKNKPDAAPKKKKPKSKGKVKLSFGDD
ncbi:hypothetical protein H072_1466 [Dactylellina haptotyla CBS 200.50]|uniref:DUF4604 domain-containing protein n=1 Tax=Dactylellina haptotyla (strain CBS 200.50) TaxID=1284197 RepID=S8BYJ2_DACHA|nr:hypothetical protein H072_1466 [Dactylellina haptotyla CBS 200.50]